MVATVSDEEMLKESRQALAVAISASLMLVPAVPAKADPGIGGGPTFVNGSEFPFVGGLNSSLTSAFFVQNIGDEDVDLELIYSAPNGIEIVPSEGQDPTLEVGETTYFEFDVRVSSSVPAGRYPITVNLRQTLESLETSAGSNYVPALAGRLIVDVVGASAIANISAVSSLDGSPAFGNISLFYLPESGIDTLIFETRDSEFQIRLVPGDYLATFEVPNLQRQEFPFSIEDGDVLDLILEIPTIEFVGNGAVPTRDDRSAIEFVALTMDVYNNLRTLRGPVEFFARVSLDGEFVEDFPIATIPQLPERETLQRATYLREGGFEQGDWGFEFVIRNPDFELASPNIAIVNSPGLFASYIREILIAVGAVLIILLAIPRKWWLLLFKRRKKSDTESPSPVLPVKPLDEPVVTKRPQRLVIPKVDLPKVEIPSVSLKLPARLNLFAGLKKKSDPFERYLNLRRELESLEVQGLRSAELRFDLNAKLPSRSGQDGKVFTDEQVSSIQRYKVIKNEIAKLRTDEFEQRAFRILMEERLASRSASEGVTS